MGRTSYRSERQRRLHDDEPSRFAAPPGRSRLQHRLRLVTGALVASLAVLLLLPLLAAQELLSRRRGRLLTLLVLLALGAGSLLREQAPPSLPTSGPPPSVERQAALTHGALRGHVLDLDGSVVPGAIVRVLRGVRSDETFVADERGEFVTGPLPTGPVTLEVHRPGESLPAVRTGASVDGGDGRLVLRLADPASLEVLVSTGDGPLAGCDVRLVDPLVTRYGSHARSQAQPTRATDTDGRARFEGLPPGRYFVRAELPDRDASVLGHVDLQPGGASRVVLDTGSLRTLTVRVVDPEGRPVRGVFMDVSMPGINWQDMPSARTDADGVAVLHDLPPGLAEVHLGQGALWRMVRSAGDEATFTWTQATSIDVRGRVAGLEGEVLVAYVLPDVVHVTHAWVEGGRLDATITPPAGAGRVYLVAPDRALAPVDLGVVDADERRLDVDASFSRGATVRGRLVDARTGEGVPGRVHVRSDLAGALEARAQWLGDTANDEWITVNEWSRATTADGRFELDGLPPGEEAALTLEGLGATPVELAVQTTDDASVTDLQDVSLEPR